MKIYSVYDPEFRHYGQIVEGMEETVQQIQTRGKKEIENAQRKTLSDIEEYRNGIQGECDRIVSSVAPEMETAAAIFVKNIISNRI